MKDSTFYSEMCYLIFSIIHLTQLQLVLTSSFKKKYQQRFNSVQRKTALQTAHFSPHRACLHYIKILNRQFKIKNLNHHFESTQIACHASKQEPIVANVASS